jgi:hypothetical protein
MMKADRPSAGGKQREVGIEFVIFPMSWHTICKSSQPIQIKIQFLTKSVKSCCTQNFSLDVLFHKAEDKTCYQQHYKANLFWR